MINKYKIIRSKYVKEVEGEICEYTHEKTGAKIIVIENESDDKSFTIGFKTIPEDSTGVAHIIEHSVLSGSKKYNIKEPFVELMKGSLNTFLNAMTFSDKTIYPVASQNEEDLYNLMDVYCDAVFNPNIKSEKEIFMQEGWYYEIEGESLVPNGVVYNEMKGAFSSPLEILKSKVNDIMFSNCYKYVSGGIPSEIIELTYEKFKDFYDKFYHPSNCCIVLSGKINKEMFLDKIDEYLSQYEYKIIENSIEKTKTISKPIREFFTYSIEEKESSEKRAFVSINFLVDESIDNKMKMAFNLLTSLLIDSETSIIRQQLLAKGICSDIVASYDYFKAQSVLSLLLFDVDESKVDEIDKIIRESLTHIVSAGIDKEDMEAAINTLEFKVREISDEFMPNSIKNSIEIINRWSYEPECSWETLCYNEELKMIKAWASDGTFEKIIEEKILGNNQKATVVLTPERGLAEKERIAASEKLKQIKNELNDDEINEIKNDLEKLRERQIKQDTADELKCMKILSVKDIAKSKELPRVKEENVNNTRVLFYESDTKGIVYGSMKFDTRTLNRKEICYAGLLGELLGALSTKKDTYQNISKKIMRFTGGVYFQNEAFRDVINTNLEYQYFNVEFKALKNNLKEVGRLLKEILTGTEFEDKKRILRIITRISNNLKMKISSNGNMMVLKRINSKLSCSGTYDELTGGIAYYEFINELLENYDEMYPSIVKSLEDIKKKVFRKNELVLCMTGSQEDKKLFKDVMLDITDVLGNEIIGRIKIDTIETSKEAIKTRTNVQYVGMGYDINKLGFEFNGALLVAKTILSTEYLWNKVRVIGGAYGVGINMRNTGEIIMCSYRDPQLKATIDAYRGTVSFLKSFEADEEKLRRYILGTIKDIDRPLLPEAAGKKAYREYLGSNNSERIEKLRKEVLNVKIEDINNCAFVFEKIADENIICAVGSGEIIHANTELFDKIYSI